MTSIIIILTYCAYLWSSSVIQVVSARTIKALIIITAVLLDKALEQLFISLMLSLLVKLLVEPNALLLQKQGTLKPVESILEDLADDIVEFLVYIKQVIFG